MYSNCWKRRQVAQIWWLSPFPLVAVTFSPVSSDRTEHQAEGARPASHAAARLKAIARTAEPPA